MSCPVPQIGTLGFLRDPGTCLRSQPAGGELGWDAGQGSRLCSLSLHHTACPRGPSGHQTLTQVSPEGEDGLQVGRYSGDSVAQARGVQVELSEAHQRRGPEVRLGSPRLKDGCLGWALAAGGPALTLPPQRQCCSCPQVRRRGWSGGKSSSCCRTQPTSASPHLQVAPLWGPGAQSPRQARRTAGGPQQNEKLLAVLPSAAGAGWDAPQGRRGPRDPPLQEGPRLGPVQTLMSIRPWCLCPPFILSVSLGTLVLDLAQGP